MLDFNVTHTRGVALIAHLERAGLARRRRHRGVDRTLAHDGLARKFLTARERAAIASLDDDARRRAFLRLWTCKEAMSKATGDGLSAPFDAIGIDTHGRLAVVEGRGAYAPRAGRCIRSTSPTTLLATLAMWSSTAIRRRRDLSDTRRLAEASARGVGWTMTLS